MKVNEKYKHVLFLIVFKIFNLTKKHKKLKAKFYSQKLLASFLF